MKYSQFRVARFAGDSLKYLNVLLVVLAGFIPGGPAVADDLETCLTEMLMQSGDSTTVGEIRARCAQRTQAELPDEEVIQPTVVSDRLEQDRKQVFQPFTLMAHKPNYFLAAAHNSKGYDPELFREQYLDPSIEFDDTEAQFQISLKAPLWVDLFDKVDIYAAYTNRSFWQVYSSEMSSPFRETNHEPEVWVQFTPSWEISFSAYGYPLGVAPSKRTVSEARISSVRQCRSKHEYHTKGFVSGTGYRATLSKTGKRFINLITDNF